MELDLQPCTKYACRCLTTAEFYRTRNMARVMILIYTSYTSPQSDVHT